jgi:hypothetical protein
MKKFWQIVLIVIALAILLFFIFHKSQTQPVLSDSIVGCYVNHNDKNVYTLSILNQTNSAVSGTMEYNNFQFDSSSGNFNGTYSNNILLGDYSFTSEGMDSVRQLIFKRIGNDFIIGEGDYTNNGDKQVFSDISNITWNPIYTFISTPCSKSKS